MNAAYDNFVTSSCSFVFCWLVVGIMTGLAFVLHDDDQTKLLQVNHFDDLVEFNKANEVGIHLRIGELTLLVIVTSCMVWRSSKHIPAVLCFNTFVVLPTAIWLAMITGKGWRAVQSDAFIDFCNRNDKSYLQSSEVKAALGNVLMLAMYVIMTLVQLIVFVVIVSRSFCCPESLTALNRRRWLDYLQPSWNVLNENEIVEDALFGSLRNHDKPLAFMRDAASMKAEERANLIERLDRSIVSCSVCLEPLESDKLRHISQVNCSGQHMFHSNCIANWRKHKSTCPNCNEAIR